SDCIPGTGCDSAVTRVTRSKGVPGMQSEHTAILRLTERPTAVVEIAAGLGLPVSITKVLLSDLLAAGRVSARHPHKATLIDLDILEQVLVGLRNL
uniref:DUF742 domain-containing protein n=1 Tax=Streptomyces torulosus TaxID=68276 RepID=UPI0006EBC103